MRNGKLLFDRGLGSLSLSFVVRIPPLIFNRLSFTDSLSWIYGVLGFKVVELRFGGCEFDGS